MKQLQRQGKVLSGPPMHWAHHNHSQHQRRQYRHHFPWGNPPLLAASWRARNASGLSASRMIPSSTRTAHPPSRSPGSARASALRGPFTPVSIVAQVPRLPKMHRMAGTIPLSDARRVADGDTAWVPWVRMFGAIRRALTVAIGLSGSVTWRIGGR